MSVGITAAIDQQLMKDISSDNSVIEATDFDNLDAILDTLIESTCSSGKSLTKYNVSPWVNLCLSSNNNHASIQHEYILLIQLLHLGHLGNSVLLFCIVVMLPIHINNSYDKTLL